MARDSAGDQDNRPAWHGWEGTRGAARASIGNLPAEFRALWARRGWMAALRGIGDGSAYPHMWDCKTPFACDDRQGDAARLFLC